MSHLKAILNRVIIRQDPVKVISDTGIITTIKTDNNKKPQRGVVVSAAPRCKLVKEGDQIFFTMYAGRWLRHEEEDLIVMTESEILGIIDDRNRINVGETYDYEEIVDMFADHHDKQQSGEL